MKSTHRLFFADARRMDAVADGSIALVVTSPPYPMIEMWDASFSGQCAKVRAALQKGEGLSAFSAMHELLDPVWEEVARVLMPGGLACINIGDATRSIDGCFMLYPNHARILTSLVEKGLSPLPAVIWRKQTNAPNKFMGSGMLPAGAYVTLEHEYVLIARKGGKRAFETPAEKEARRGSAIFWEERNVWFSDVWTDLKGVRQVMPDKTARERSGAFPFALASRLINMYSVAGDTVLDPFLGAGTTMLAAMAAGRSSIGFELSAGLSPVIHDHAQSAVAVGTRAVAARLESHERFAEERLALGKVMKYKNRFHGFPVVTRQEQEICLRRPTVVAAEGSGRYRVDYEPCPCGSDRYGGSAPPARGGGRREPK
jgi:DNA modification methylase